jgi:hypothetical protein
MIKPANKIAALLNHMTREEGLNTDLDNDEP